MLIFYVYANLDNSSKTKNSRVFQQLLDVLLPLNQQFLGSFLFSGYHLNFPPHSPPITNHYTTSKDGRTAVFPQDQY